MEGLIRVSPALIALAVAASVTLAGLILIPIDEGNPWKSWQVLALDPKVDRTRLENLLNARGVKVLNLRTQNVDIADYSGTLVALSLESIGTRFLPGDPRIDDYIKNIPRYFYAKRGVETLELWYFHDSPLHIIPSTRGLEEAMPGVVLLKGRHPNLWLMWIIRFLALVGFALLIVTRNRDRLANILLFVPWLLLCLRSPFTHFALAGASFLPFLSSRVIGDFSRAIIEKEWREARHGSVPKVLLGFAFPIWATIILQPEYLLLAIVALGAFAFMLAIVAATLNNFRGGRKAFIAVPINRGGKTFRGAQVARTFALPGLFLILALIPSLVENFGVSDKGDWWAPSNSFSSIILPLPSKPLASAEARPLTVLPNLRGFERHIEFQQSFFMRPLDRQDADSGSRTNVPLGFMKVSAPQGGDTIPTRFPERGFGIEAILRDQGEGIEVREASLADASILPLAPFAVILYILPMVFAFMSVVFRKRTDQG